MQKDFASGVIIERSGVHLDMTSNQVLSVARKNGVYQLINEHVPFVDGCFECEK
jgi:hypothetical protein